MRADSIAVEATGRNACAAAAKLMKKSPEWVWDNLPGARNLKLQQWWSELCAGVRGLRHLKPLDYIKLSERSSETAHV
jgi:hypothetical protein